MSAKREHRISQAGFARLQEVLLRAEFDGYGPDAAAANALRCIGLQPEPYVETIFVVDPMLDSS